MIRVNIFKINDFIKLVFLDVIVSFFFFIVNFLDSCVIDLLVFMSLVKFVFIFFVNLFIFFCFLLYIVLYLFMKERYDFGVMCVV